MELAARQRRLEHIARIHRPFGLAGADHRVQLIDEDDGLAFVLGQLMEHGLEALFEFATELGASQQGGHVQGEHALALERVGHFTIDDALGQALDDGGLAHTGLADEHRVVLAAPLQHLDGAADFVIAPDHRVELAGAGALGQIKAVLLERIALALTFGAVHFFATAHRVDGRLHDGPGHAAFAGHASDIALVVGASEQEKLGGNIGVAAFDGFFFSGLQQAAQIWADLNLLLTLHLRQLFQASLNRRLQMTELDTGALEQGPWPLVLCQHGRQHMHRLDIGVVAPECDGLGIAQRLRKLGG